MLGVSANFTQTVFLYLYLCICVFVLCICMSETWEPFGQKNASPFSVTFLFGALDGLKSVKIEFHWFADFKFLDETAVSWTFHQTAPGLLICHHVMLSRFEFYILSRFSFCSKPISFKFCCCTPKHGGIFPIKSPYICSTAFQKSWVALAGSRLRNIFSPFRGFDFARETKWRLWLGNYEERLVSCWERRTGGLARKLKFCPKLNKHSQRLKTQ